MTTTTIPSRRQILTTAASIIEQRGWSQAEGIARFGAVGIVAAMKLATADLICLEAAPTAVVSGDREVWPEATRDGLKRIFDRAMIRVASEIGGGHVGEWNDEPGRTGAEVVAVLREAAENCDPCDEPGGCGRDHGDCECGAHLECDDDWPSGECDSCWQARDEFGGNL